MSKARGKAGAGRQKPPGDSQLRSAQANEADANRRCRTDWELYQGHRRRLTAAITALLPPGDGRIALLGAGNCNDVDVEALLKVAGTVALVDLDGEAIAAARARLPAALRDRVTCHAPVDLSGLFAWLDEGTGQAPTMAEVEAQVAAGLARVRAAVPGTFHAAVSCCVMTQMSWGLARAIGDEHPLMPQLREVMMNIHLRTLAALLEPGGQALLACDLISSQHHPLDDLPPDADLRALMDELVARENFYRGANPVLLRRLLRRDPVLSTTLTEVRWLDPWLWTGPLGRTYFVYAVAAQRTGGVI